MNRSPRYTAAGIRHATINGHRLHLRLIDPAQDNLLWINGQSPPLVLDQVAAEFIGHVIDAMWEHQQGDDDATDRVREDVVERMFRRYGTRLLFGKHRVDRRRIAADLDRVWGMVMAVAEGGCPVEAGAAPQELRHDDWAAPARMDLAITYRCNLDCGHCYAGGPRNLPELATDDWHRVCQAVWQAGVPQIVFTGGEPTMREDLVCLVEQADEFVTGLVTNGTNLEALAEPLRNASLDYVQVTLESQDPGIHNRMVGATDFDAFERTVAGIRQALTAGLEVVTNTTLTSANAADFHEFLRFGRGLGLKNMACNGLICSGRGTAAKRADDLDLEELKRVLEQANETAKLIGVNLQWYTPTCYHELNPLELGFGPKSCSAAAHNMTIQPDGTVLPCQSWPETVGQMLDDPWPRIWNHPTCRSLRGRDLARRDDRCANCELLMVCGGGCPLDRQPPQGGQA